MDVDREQLYQLKQEIGRQSHLRAMLDDLYIQQAELEQRVEELRQQKEDEQKDVDRLEERGLAALFYSLIGKMDEKLTKEQQEAYEAAVRYESAEQELASVSQNIDVYKKELTELEGCEERYTAQLEKMRTLIMGMHTEKADDLLRLEERMSELHDRLREIDEAYNAGEKAVITTDVMIERLESAAAWGTWDMLGGGIITTMVKHSNLDEAQKEISELQIALRQFKTELVDVSINADFQVHIDGFLKFADYFFDGLFSDWSVQNRINQSRTQVNDVKQQIMDVMVRLREMREETERLLSDTRSEVEMLIVK